MGTSFRSPPPSTRPPRHEVVLLSSSPPRIPDSDIITTPPGLRNDPYEPLLSPSSPNLPSPTALFKRKPQGSKSGSRAADIPHGAALGFASAGALVRERRLSLGEDKVEEEPELPRGGDEKDASEGKASKPKKRAQKKAVAGTDEDPGTKKPRKRNTKADGEAILPSVEKTDERVPAKNTTKRRTKADTLAIGGPNISDDSIGKPKETAKPRKKGVKTALDNSEIIKEALGLSAENPGAVADGGGAVEKLQKLKARAHTAQPSPGPADVTVIPAKPQELGPEAQKPMEKKPRKKRAKAPPEQEVAAAVIVTDSVSEPKPKSRKPAARKASEKTSKHFSLEIPIDPAVLDLQEAPVVVSEQPLETSPAMVRRRSWTPPKDTNSSPSGQRPSKPIDVSGSPAPAAAPSEPRPSLTNLLNCFSYKEQRPDSTSIPAPRTESGEAFMKRRKLELIDKPHQSAESGANESREASPEKQEKLRKKKPRTITDLATAAYRTTAAPAEARPIDPQVSTFFSSRAGSGSVADPAEIPILEGRKGAARSKSPTKQAESKNKKPSAKSKKATKLAAEKLLSPQTALLKMNRQDVLFGTSSQLAREDSPTFIRDLQQALRDSEIVGTQSETVETLHLKPATVGSGFSLVGRRKGLWAAATRDLDDGILREERQDASSRSEPDVFMDDSIIYLSDAGAKAPSPTQDQTAATFLGDDIGGEPRPALGGAEGEANELIIEDLPQAPLKIADDNSLDGLPATVPAQPSSDYVDIDEFDRQYPSTQPASCVNPPKLVSRSPSSPDVARRTILQPLSTRPNIPLLNKTTSDITGIRSKSTLVRNSVNLASESLPEIGQSPAKRPRGRQRKDATSEPEVVSTKQPRGRPRKSASPEPRTHKSKDPAARPAKAATATKARSRATTSKGKASKTQTAAKPTTPKKKKRIQEEEWPDIDEIEDSEEEISPSPPRRKNIPIASPRLALSLSQEDPGAARELTAASVPVSPSRKPKTTPHIPHESLRAVYPQITTAVKAAPPSEDPSRPSWHEKMLLYDPIVVEDLVKWLNGEGLRVGVVVPVPKPPKKKGRKKDAEDADTPMNDEETERVEMQELPGWVVQGWCEENSVCCIYKETLRNGRRAKYR